MPRGFPGIGPRKAEVRLQPSSQAAGAAVSDRVPVLLPLPVAGGFCPLERLSVHQVGLRAAPGWRKGSSRGCLMLD